jgi:hypothetical protein
MEERTTATLSNGATLRLEVSRSQLAVVVDAGGSPRTRRTLPYPAHGYGGHEMVVSPGERYLALFLYSGQSEVGYELFELRPELRHVASLPYVYGEGAPPAFSDDERWLVLASALDPYLSPEDESTNDDGSITWAEVRVQEVPAGRIAVCSIWVRLPPNAEEREECCYPEVVSVSGEVAIIRSPWGGVFEVSLPPQTSVELVQPT